MTEAPCPFCEIVAGRAPATFVHEWSDAIAIVPLDPVVDGHVLVIPKTHVADFTTDPSVTGATAQRAAELARDLDLMSANLITSKGRAATQSVFHLHQHLAPPAENDGLTLPWYSGRSRVQVTMRPDPPHIAEAIRDIRRFGLPPLNPRQARP